MIDLRDILSNIRTRSPEEYNELFQGHMTYKGNELVAEHILQAMEHTQGDESEGSE